MTYTVKGADGTVIREYKALAAAKKLADKTKGAFVYYGDEQVYPEKSVSKKKDLFQCKVMIRVNIRKSPSLEAAKVGIADVGSTLEAYEDIGDWYRIKYQGGTAYVRHKDHEYIREV